MKKLSSLLLACAMLLALAACGGGTTLVLREIQAEGTRRMTAEEYLCGHPLPTGARLESE